MSSRTTGPALVRGFLFNVECDRCPVDLRVLRIFGPACFAVGWSRVTEASPCARLFPLVDRHGLPKVFVNFYVATIRTWGLSAPH